MGARENIQKVVDQKQAENREFEMRIRENNAYVQALQYSMRFLPKDSGSAPSVDSDNETSLRPGTILARVQELIKKHGAPMHVNAILLGLGKTTDVKSRVSLVGTLGSYSRKGKVFTRSAPNTFSLLEFGDDSAKDTEIPEEFGRMVSMKGAESDREAS